MDRRKYLKTLALGTTGAAVLLQQACSPTEKPVEAVTPPSFTIDRNEQELEREKKLLSEKFFTAHELNTISILADIIIPRDDVSGSATDAGVPDFIEFIAKDMPRYQTPLRGGLKWLDLQSMRRFNTDFASCTNAQQLEIVDDIAFPEKAKIGMEPGIAFFNMMRDLTACGFFTSKIGIADLGYMGNRPNKWNGVPQEVLDQYGVKYDDRTLEICARYDV